MSSSIVSSVTCDTTEQEIWNLSMIDGREDIHLGYSIRYGKYHYGYEIGVKFTIKRSNVSNDQILSSIDYMKVGESDGFCTYQTYIGNLMYNYRYSPKAYLKPLIREVIKGSKPWCPYLVATCIKANTDKNSIVIPRRLLTRDENIERICMGLEHFPKSTLRVDMIRYDHEDENEPEENMMLKIMSNMILENTGKAPEYYQLPSTDPHRQQANMPSMLSFDPPRQQAPQLPSMSSMGSMQQLPSMGSMQQLPSISTRQQLPSMSSIQQPQLPSMSSMGSRQQLPTMGSRQQLPTMGSRQQLPTMGSRQQLPTMSTISTGQLPTMSSIAPSPPMPTMSTISTRQQLPTMSSIAPSPPMRSNGPISQDYIQGYLDGYNEAMRIMSRK